MTSNHTVTLEELSSRVDEILTTVQETGRPVIVTQGGRFLATVVPLEAEGEGGADE